MFKLNPLKFFRSPDDLRQDLMILHAQKFLPYIFGRSGLTRRNALDSFSKVFGLNLGRDTSFPGFPRSLEENTHMTSWLRQFRFLPNPFRFIFYNSTLNILTSAAGKNCGVMISGHYWATARKQ
jgi:hypothetical protein